jgi:hypothetical protein
MHLQVYETSKLMTIPWFISSLWLGVFVFKQKLVSHAPSCKPQATSFQNSYFQIPKVQPPAINDN